MAFAFLRRCALFFLLAAPAGAHPFLQDAMWVLLEPERVRVAVNVSLKEIFVAQGIAAADDGYETAMLEGAAEKHRDYVASHLAVATDGRVLSGAVTKVTPPPEFSSAEKTFYLYELDYALAGPRPAQVSLRHEMLREFSYAPGTPWDVSYVVRLKRADSSEVTTGLLRAQAPAEFPTGWEAAPAQGSTVVKVDGWRTFREYCWHGVLHILTGYDHLLFVAALVLATASFWEMVKVIGAFTLAHTLTLALSVFDLVRLPAWVVEPVIAASIVFVALENVFFPRRAHSWVRLGVAFGFGLIHGLGFAGGLLDAMAGLPAIGIWIALAAFSLGVELGHQLVVLPLFGALRFGGRHWDSGFPAGALRFGSLAISLGGFYYFVHAVRAA